MISQSAFEHKEHDMTTAIDSKTIYYDRLDKVLDTFQWAYQNREHNRGEIRLDRDTDELVMSIFVPDSDDEGYDPAETPLVPLEGRFEIDRSLSPERMIRACIHAYVCHEADEQMWFGEERTFNPHQPAYLES
jgi:hypothetical protein